jgi:hypothetical protein
MRSLESRPIHLDQGKPRLPPATTSLVTEPELPRWLEEFEKLMKLQHKKLMQQEKEAYENLVADGGRPWHPLGLLEDVSEHPEEYQEMILFWCWGSKRVVFAKQWERWQKFGQWQQDNRGVLDVQDELRSASTCANAETLDDFAFTADREVQWAQPLRGLPTRRTRGYHYTVEHGVAGKEGEARFMAYVMAVQACLQRHGFAGPVELARDASGQDKLTTWIEYLNYEYWVRDGFVEKVEHIQPQYDAALKGLLDAGMLLPGEAPESAVAFAQFNPSSKRRSASKAAMVAKYDVSAAQSALERLDQSSVQRQEREAALGRAHERLNKALDTVNAVERQCHLVSCFQRANSDLSVARWNAKQHEILLEWILGQIHLVQQEMARAEAGPSSGQKRARDEVEEEALEWMGVKKQKSDTHVSRPARAEQTEPELRAPSPTTGRKRTREDGDEGNLEASSPKTNKPETESSPPIQPELHARVEPAHLTPNGEDSGPGKRQPNKPPKPHSKLPLKRHQPSNKAIGAGQRAHSAPLRRSQRTAAAAGGPSQQAAAKSSSKAVYGPIKPGGRRRGWGWGRQGQLPARKSLEEAPKGAR